MLSGITDEQDFLDGDLELIKRCDFVVAIDGWLDSEGSRGEMDFCGLNNISRYTSVEAAIKSEN